MTRYLNPSQLVSDDRAQNNFQTIQQALGEALQFIYWGAGAPTLTPEGNSPALYFQTDGSPGSAIWAYDTSSWINWA